MDMTMIDLTGIKNIREGNAGTGIWKRAARTGYCAGSRHHSLRDTD